MRIDTTNAVKFVCEIEPTDTVVFCGIKPHEADNNTDGSMLRLETRNEDNFQVSVYLSWEDVQNLLDYGQAWLDRNWPQDGTDDEPE